MATVTTGDLEWRITDFAVYDQTNIGGMQSSDMDRPGKLWWRIRFNYYYGATDTIPDGKQFVYYP